MPTARLTKLRAKELVNFAKRQGAPPAALSIPGEVKYGNKNYETAGAAIKQIGSCRRVFLLKRGLKPVELEGLAYRIGALSRNEALSSILIATNDSDDVETQAMPTSAIDSIDPPAAGFFSTDIRHIAAGYDPIEIYKTGEYKNGSFLDHLRDLALACRGDSSKIPLVTVPHGLVTDGGYALCMGSYVLATMKTSFEIRNASRGLSLDPIGLSYFLPRLGREYKLKAADYNVDILLALGGATANAMDLMETGLATHYIDSPAALGTLENALGSLDSYEHQAYARKPVTSYGDPPPRDVNMKYKNIAVANLIHLASEFESNGQGFFNDAPEPEYDPSLDLDQPDWELERQSDLVDMAERLQGSLGQKTLSGLVTSLQKVPNDDEAKTVVQRLNMNSPLAMRVIFRLLKTGREPQQTLESCMDREWKVQKAMFNHDDFLRWAEHVSNHGGDETNVPPFNGWKHKTPTDVSPKEVDEIFK
mmetsp:Transcript_654/g.922  ORF Transcript_654/g.922 Transcript_654/m.922 type:complete len:477 (-) Transcript_654:46-1476(-)